MVNCSCRAMVRFLLLLFPSINSTDPTVGDNHYVLCPVKLQSLIHLKLWLFIILVVLPTSIWIEQMAIFLSIICTVSWVLSFPPPRPFSLIHQKCHWCYEIQHCIARILDEWLCHWIGNPNQICRFCRPVVSKMGWAHPLGVFRMIHWSARRMY